MRCSRVLGLEGWLCEAFLECPAIFPWDFSGQLSFALVSKLIPLTDSAIMLRREICFCSFSFQGLLCDVDLRLGVLSVVGRMGRDRRY